MTHPIDDGTRGGGELAPPLRGADRATDPVLGAGITLLGIFLMGTGGARDSHLVFDVGVLLALVGAVVFVLFVALSALRQRRQPVGGEDPPA